MKIDGMMFVWLAAFLIVGAAPWLIGVIRIIDWLRP